MSFCFPPMDGAASGGVWQMQGRFAWWRRKQLQLSQALPCERQLMCAARDTCSSAFHKHLNVPRLTPAVFEELRAVLAHYRDCINAVRMAMAYRNQDSDNEFD